MLVIIALLTNAFRSLTYLFLGVSPWAEELGKGRML